MQVKIWTLESFLLWEAYQFRNILIKKLFQIYFKGMDSLDIIFELTSGAETAK